MADAFAFSSASRLQLQWLQSAGPMTNRTYGRRYSLTYLLITSLINSLFSCSGYSPLVLWQMELTMKQINVEVQFRIKFASSPAILRPLKHIYIYIYIYIYDKWNLLWPCGPTGTLSKTSFAVSMNVIVKHISYFVVFIHFVLLYDILILFLEVSFY